MFFCFWYQMISRSLGGWGNTAVLYNYYVLEWDGMMNDVMYFMSFYTVIVNMVPRLQCIIHLCPLKDMFFANMRQGFS